MLIPMDPHAGEIVLAIKEHDHDLLGRLARQHPESVSDHAPIWAWTPLHFAVMEDDPEAIEILIDHGAEVNGSDDMARTPLHMAVGHGNIECVKVLLERGANPNLATDARNEDWAPLHVAMSKQYLEIMELLLRCGADPNQEFKGHTPLWYEVNDPNADPEIERMLVRYGANRVK